MIIVITAVFFTALGYVIGHYHARRLNTLDAEFWKKLDRHD